MLSFENDYSEGAHENILKRLTETNLVQESGYGYDDFSRQAVEKIKDAIQCPEATVQFLVGGTQTNQIVIDALLKNYEGVIAADTGHISSHEAGAIELSGHKVLTLPSVDGKITGKQVRNYLETFYEDPSHPHMVFPGMVYLSFPTEYGTLYSLAELQELSAVCRQYTLPLYIDGARLGYGLMAPTNEVSLAQLAALCDVFYIGGTKIGALCGEAVVFTKNNQPKNFITIVKQHGGLLAKGRLLGIQFLELFTQDLYFKLSQHAITMALKLKNGFTAKGYPLYLDSPTNQQFFIFDHEQFEKLQQLVKFSFWERLDEQHIVVRFATSWATKDADIDWLLEQI